MGKGPGSLEWYFFCLFQVYYALFIVAWGTVPCMPLHVWRPEENLWESFLSFSDMGSRNLLRGHTLTCLAAMFTAHPRLSLWV